MKLCRFEAGGERFLGLFAGDVFEVCDEELEPTGQSFAPSEVRFAPPVLPSKIVCVGRNYADHARELGNEIPSEPLLFLKAPSALITDGEPISLPLQSNQVEHEAELAVVIARRCKDIPDDADPLDFVLGYTSLNDVTARDLQRRDVQFTRAKSFDTFCPVGRFVETDFDPSDKRIVCRVNGKIVQDARTSAMIFSIPFLIRYISRQMTVNAGDLIATGTPSGVSRLAAGDTCAVEIEGLAPLVNAVESGAIL